jgi:hypothetical protein
LEVSATVVVAAESFVEEDGGITVSSTPPDSSARSSRDSTVKRKRLGREDAGELVNIFATFSDQRWRVMLQLLLVPPARKGAPGWKGIGLTLSFS